LRTGRASARESLGTWKIAHFADYIAALGFRLFFACELVLLQACISLADDALDLRKLASWSFWLAQVGLAAAIPLGDGRRGSVVSRLRS
jgi:hypothetical protein